MTGDLETIIQRNRMLAIMKAGARGLIASGLRPFRSGPAMVAIGVAPVLITIALGG